MAEVSEVQVVETGLEERVQHNVVRVRGRLGQKLASLIMPDLENYYTHVRDIAFGASHTVPRTPSGHKAKSAAQVQLRAMKLFLDLLKLANADMDVEREDFDGTVDGMLKMIRQAQTADLPKLEREIKSFVEAAEVREKYAKVEAS